MAVELSGNNFSENLQRRVRVNCRARVGECERLTVVYDARKYTAEEMEAQMGERMGMEK
jgi:hypothetical protein